MSGMMGIKVLKENGNMYLVAGRTSSFINDRITVVQKRLAPYRLESVWQNKDVMVFKLIK